MSVENAGDALSGVLRLRIGGVERTCPTLKLRASREWLDRQARKMPFLIERLAAEQTAANDVAFLDFSYEAGLEAVLDYDTTGALGGREWLEENADPAELYAIFRAMARVAVPFGNDLQTLLSLLLTVVPDLLEPDDGSSPPSSTNGPSPSGASTRTRSRRASTRAS